MKDNWPREKRWKDLYTRSRKQIRARQLGFEYPRTTEQQLIQDEIKERNEERLKVLFVCSQNQWRSPTAEQVLGRHPSLLTRSGGTSPNARHAVTVDDVRWADIILAMEEKHKARLIAKFTRLLANKTIHVLGIPDDYKYMDPTLIEILQREVPRVLGIE